MKVPLYEHQKEAVEKMHNGCILVGGVGSGKSRTALYYYWKYETNRMKRPKPLYIITTARKRDSKDWQGEALYFGLSDYEELSEAPLVVDSWNNIHKYTEVQNAFFIFDEQRVVGYGSWTKAFIRICSRNRWILLSATPGDTWMDYIPVFIANRFYRNKSEFVARHVIYSRFSKYPKVQGYLDVDLLEKHKADILVDMEFDHLMESVPKLVECSFNKEDFMKVFKDRWNIFTGKPIKQAGEWCYLMRRVVNSDLSRLEKLIEIFEKKKKVIVFYNFDYELEEIKNGLENANGAVAEYNGHRHEPIPDTERWIYLVQYSAGAEAWNCIETDTIVFYSLNYSYKIMEQASGRIRRMNSPFNYLYYYVLYSKSFIDRSILTALKNKRNFNESRTFNKTFGGN